MPASTPSVWPLFKDNAETIFGIVNAFSGGALERMSIFTMGVMPYISASIIVQMMAGGAVVDGIPQEGEAGRGRQVHPDHALRHAGPGVCSSRSSRRAGLQAQGRGRIGPKKSLFVAIMTMTTVPCPHVAG